MEVSGLTKRERYLRALRNEQVDELVWAPNFDYWLQVNRAEGTLPLKYREMSRNDIVRSLGASIWNRASGFKTVYDNSVQFKTWEDGDENLIQEIETPIGSLRSVSKRSEGKHRSKSLTEHFIKDLDSLKTMKYVAEAMHYEQDYEQTRRALAQTGDDGIVLNMCLCVPFIQFAKTDAGYINGYFMWMDYKQEVDALINVYFKKFLQGYGILAAGPADVVATGDNMDGVMISPDIFREYAVPFYQEAKKIITAGGKIFEGHWCGRTQNLLPLVPGCGLDVVEAIVTKPMADIALPDALELLGDRVVLQGGIPSVLVCREGASLEEFEEYVREVIRPLKGRRGYIVGMSDNVPPNADFERIEQIAKWIQ